MPVRQSVVSGRPLKGSSHLSPAPRSAALPRLSPPWNCLQRCHCSRRFQRRNNPAPRSPRRRRSAEIAPPPQFCANVKRVCIPNRSTKSLERKREQKKRWFRNGQKWRTGCEGRVSVVKRRHGLSRCRYKGPAGMNRWVGFGVIADNLINIGRVMEQREASEES